MNAPATISQSAALVTADWEANRSAFTAEKYGSVLARFVRFAEACGATSLADVDEELVEAFVRAPGRDRGRGPVRAAAARTQGNRRSALRAFYTHAIENGWSDSDPTAAVSVPSRGRKRPPARPLTDDEAERVRFLSGDSPARPRPVIVALLLSGVWPTEAALLAPADYDPSSSAVVLSGVRERRARTVVLGEETAGVVAARLDWLRAKHGDPASLLFGVRSLANVQQTKTFKNMCEALRRAGLGGDPAVTPASLTLWAARREFERTGRIEKAAKLVGSTSLDLTARDLRWDWGAE